MLFSSSTLLAVLSSLSVTSAAPIAQTGAQNKAPLKMSFTIQKKKALSQPSMYGMKGSSLGVTLRNEYALYLAELEIGTPAQKVLIDIDTGSSDLWVPAKGTDVEFGAFDANSSSTFEPIKDGFRISYGDHSYAKGIWAHDEVTISGQAVKNVRLGYGTNQTAGEGILGVGYTSNEASLWFNNTDEYPNFPQLMKNQGLINRVSYSLYLDQTTAESGEILFGAVDTAKYYDDLYALDTLAVDDSGAEINKPTAFFVDLDSITQKGEKFTNQTYPALLDSGTTLVLAPPEIATAFGIANGVYSNKEGGYVTSCDQKGDDLTFTFGSKEIVVPFSDVLFHLDGNPANTNGTCFIGVTSSESNYYILGDVFLRSAYVYYDLDDDKIGIAQAKYTNETNIVLDDGDKSFVEQFSKAKGLRN